MNRHFARFELVKAQTHQLPLLVLFYWQKIRYFWQLVSCLAWVIGTINDRLVAWVGISDPSVTLGYKES